MNKERNIAIVILIIFLIPVIFYFIKPEINLDNHYIKFSWNQNLQQFTTSIKNRNFKQIFNNIYGNFIAMFQENRIRNNIEKTYLMYSDHTHKEINKLVRKWKNFIS